MCSFGSFSGCHGNGSHKSVKNKHRKMFFFVIYVTLKCDLPSINTPKGISMVTRNFLTLLS